MYDFFTGKVASKTPTSVVLDVGGIGYRLEIPVSTYERLQDAGGEPVKLLSYLCVREDDLKLFGFATEAERRLFEALLSVKGIGPTTALHVLSGSGVADTVRAIREGQTALLCKIKGVGKKTAERIVLELRDKADQLMPATGGGASAAATPSEDAVRALMSLGFSSAVARKAVDAAAEVCVAEAGKPGGVRVEALVKEALRHAS